MSVGLLQNSFNTTILDNVRTNSSFYVSPNTISTNFNLTSGSSTFSGTLTTYYVIFGSCVIVLFLFTNVTATGSGSFNIQATPPAIIYDPILASYNHAIPVSVEPAISIASYNTLSGIMTVNVSANLPSNTTYIAAAVGFNP